MSRAVGHLLLCGLVTGCGHLGLGRDVPYQEPTFSQYHDPAFHWEAVNRVLILPLDNETHFPHVAEEVRNALATELQELGRFEVVLAPPDIHARLSHSIREHGQFNEAAMIELARCFRADVILLGAVTQYSPYRLPRLGLTLQAVGPGECAVVASVDGVWDTTQQTVADRARSFYASGRRHSLRAQNRDQPFADELALEAPRLFQRFVANEAADVLVNGMPPLPPEPHPPNGPPAAKAAGAAAAKKGKASCPPGPTDKPSPAPANGESGPPCPSAGAAVAAPAPAGNLDTVPGVRVSQPPGGPGR